MSLFLRLFLSLFFSLSLFLSLSGLLFFAFLCSSCIALSLVASLFTSNTRCYHQPLLHRDTCVPVHHRLIFVLATLLRCSTSDFFRFLVWALDLLFRVVRTTTDLHLQRLQCRDLSRLLRYCDFARLAGVPLEPVDRDRRRRVVHDCAAPALWLVGIALLSNLRDSGDPDIDSK